MFDVLQKRLVDWIKESRLTGQTVTHMAIQIRLLNLIKMPEFAKMKPEDFIASDGWCNRYMIRHNLCTRAWTKLAQKAA